MNARFFFVVVSSFVVGVISAVAGCLVYEDRCNGVVCGDGEVCIDIARGPTCVCDDFHEAAGDDEGDGCVPLDDGADDSGGTSG